MPQDPKVRKQCQKCMRTFVVPIAQVVCQHQGFNIPPCGGRLEMHSSDREDAVTNLIAIVRSITARNALGELEAELLNTALEDLDCWSEGEQSPREMGWVDDKGRP